MTYKNNGTTLCKIKDKDSSMIFDDGEWWTTEQNWMTGPPILKNKVGCYETCLKKEERGRVEQRDRTLDRGGNLCLMGQRHECGSITINGSGSAPQRTRSDQSLDDRELNKYIMCPFCEDANDECRETLRKRRQMTGVSKIINLKSTYLQIHVAKHLWKYQLIRYKEQDLLPDLVWVKCCPKDHVSNSQSRTQKKDDMRRHRFLYRWRLSWQNCNTHIKSCKSSW